MKATQQCWAIAGTIMMLSLCHTNARADGQMPDHRWGVGWDDGVAVRYMTSPNWGLGLTLSPSIRDASDTRFTEGNFGDMVATAKNESNSKQIGIGLMVFRQAEIGGGFVLGPFARLLYNHVTSELTTNSEGATEVRTTKNNSVTLQAGIRPTFTFRDRFVLETRVGVNLVYQHSERDGAPGRRLAYTDESDSWRFDVFGQDLGPGAVMSFIVLF